MDYGALGNRIRKERQKANISQAKLAERIDVSSSFIGQIERGERKLSIETLISLADALDVSTDYLLRDNFDSYRKNFSQEISSVLAPLATEDAVLITDIVKTIAKRFNK